MLNGRFMPNRGLVFSDRAEPFVRVFTPEGVLQYAFMRAGDGPGEVRVAPNVSVNAAGRMLVSVSDRLSLWQDSVLIAQTRSRYPVVATGPGCGDEWLVYEAGPMSRGRRIWLRGLRIAASGTVSRALWEDTATVPLGYGKRLLASDGTRIALLHENGVPPTLHVFTCEGDSIRHTWSVAVDTTAAPRRQRSSAGGPYEHGLISSQRRIRAGIAVLGEGVVLAGYWRVDSAAYQTDFALVTRRHVRRVAVTGRYAILDARVGTGILLRLSEPFPRAILVDDKLFMDVLRSAPAMPHR